MSFAVGPRSSQILHPLHSPSLIRFAAVAAALAAAGCFGDSTGPRHGGPGASLAGAGLRNQRPAFRVLRPGADHADQAGRHGARHDRGASRRAPTVWCSRFDVPIMGSPETLSLNLALIDAAGDTVFRGGPEPVTLSVGVTGTGTSVPVRHPVRGRRLERAQRPDRPQDRLGVLPRFRRADRRGARQLRPADRRHADRLALARYQHRPGALGHVRQGRRRRDTRRGAHRRPFCSPTRPTRRW